MEQAKSYLNYSAFSKQGLIEQLEYEGFTSSEARTAVNSLSVDWNVQAQCQAGDYLSFSAFSKQGLIEQLEYEGFTSSEARAGANSPMDC